MVVHVRWSNDEAFWDQARHDLTDPRYAHGRLADVRLRGRVQLEFGDDVLFPSVTFDNHLKAYERVNRRAELRGRKPQMMIDPSLLWGGGCSITDFARFVAWILDVHERKLSNEGDTLEFQDSDGGMRLLFTRTGNDIVITSDPMLGSSDVPRLTVPEDALFDGLQEFLVEFADAARRNAPGILDWKQLERVKAYERE